MLAKTIENTHWLFCGRYGTEGRPKVVEYTFDPDASRKWTFMEHPIPLKKFSLLIETGESVQDAIVNTMEYTSALDCPIVLKEEEVSDFVQGLEEEATFIFREGEIGPKEELLKWLIKARKEL